MRYDCRHFESRTYASGETVRKCNLDLAPEAPWRCPADCPRYEKKRTDVAWSYGSMVRPPTPPEPPSLDTDPEGVARLLDEAEDIVNAALPEVLAEVGRPRRGGLRSLWDRLRRRR